MLDCKETFLDKLSNIMDENWNPIKSEWVMGLKSSCGNFPNNRLESINGKLKQVINRNSSLEEFIRHFFHNLEYP